jgi:hypothetical protein
MAKKLFRVYGEYGPIAAMVETRYIEAETPEKARAIFIRKMKEGCPDTWKNMGEHNVYVDQKPAPDPEIARKAKIKKQQIFRDLCTLHGAFPDNTGSNICYGDGYYANSLEKKHKMSISEMEKLVNFTKYQKTLDAAQKLVHDAFINNIKEGN